MRMQLQFPVPSNLVVQHPVFGSCYWHDGKLYRAESGMELMTSGVVNIATGWSTYVEPKGDKVFHLFEIQLKDGTVGKVGSTAADQKSAEMFIRAKLGLDQTNTLKFVEAFADANTAKFEELKMSKVGGGDDIQSMQSNLQNAQPQSDKPEPTGVPINPNGDPRMNPPENKAIETKDGTQPVQAPADPSAPVVAPEGTASVDAPPTTGSPSLTVR